jgi:ATP-dependent DNA helicase RecQ
VVLTVEDVVHRYWGFSSLRPLQREAIDAVLSARDSLVILPTGGGKSLCYQAPAIARGETTVVVSPLISLMKDQVDALKTLGIPARQINSSQSGQERKAAEDALIDGELSLLFVSPERLAMSGFQELVRNVGVRTFAIDEAHCISHWGHDFRPEYRQLSRLKTLFPGATVHAYTATATEQVRRDIAAQLQLADPLVLIGDFDRPNLVYRVVPRQNELAQVLELIERHPGEGGIIYCLRRRDVDELTAELRERELNAMPYHAGLAAEERKRAQDAFSSEECDLIVATVAFGMGIDRSNIRFVLHTAMPKSIEHYQQETGRAGRDGLPADCHLLYSAADVILWKTILANAERGTAEAVDPAFLRSSLKHVDEMDRYCRGSVCRHRALVEYFGQPGSSSSCGACDLCLGDTEPVPDGHRIAQKILSCVARVKENFGIGHLISVLRGENNEKVRKFGHEQLSTYGLLREFSKGAVRDWIYQLIGQGVLRQTEGEYPVLQLNAESWEVMKDHREVRLIQIVRAEKRKKAKVEKFSWEGVDRDLFEVLRGLRRRLAEERAVPPYIIFNDATLRELARRRPATLAQMRAVHGIGDHKLSDFGELFLRAIGEHQTVVDRPPSGNR